MSLAIAVIGLLIWAGYGIWDALTPPAPPIPDMDKHYAYLMSLPNEKARRKYLRNRKPGDV